ncbi:DUF6302 family protein [Streptomyces sp. R21]|uniref:DUF6302 family protein n=1 Tax=Streptomyces sp. R21 TaxID=3238627 RepID=A0AB39NX07_9ACTN
MTHDPNAAKHPGVTATVMAAPQDAYDFYYYEQRIADAWLLDKSIAVRTLRMPFLAVPVGGSRRGGYFPVTCLCFGLRVRDVLLEQPGFPDPRLRWSPYPDTCHVVEWGERPPTLWGDCDDVTLGRFYGYSEDAIARFTNRRASTPRGPQTPSSAALLRSPAAP